LNFIFNEQKKEEIANESLNSLNVKDDKNVSSYRNIYEYIDGRFAGVTVSNSNEIKIRGGSSWELSNEPLFVVDGVIVDSIDNISPLDGKSFKEVILNDKTSKHDRFYYYSYTHLQAVRDIEWKLVLPRKAKPKYMKWAARKVEKVEGIQLFNLKNDKEEQYNLAEQYPEKVKELLLLIEEGRKELGDHNKIGEGARFFDTDSKTQRINEYNKWKNSLKK